jgi:hypothetical protein
MRVESDLAVSLRIQFARAFPASVLSSAIGIIERQVYEMELESLAAAAVLIPGLPTTTLDAVRGRLKKSRRRVLLITDVKPGSIVVVGLVTAFGIWILNQTVAETLKSAWKRAPLHHRLEQFLAQERPVRVKRLKESVQTDLNDLASGLKDDGFTVSVEVREDQARSALNVTISFRRPRGPKAPTTRRRKPPRSPSTRSSIKRRPPDVYP